MIKGYEIYKMLKNTDKYAISNYGRLINTMKEFKLKFVNGRGYFIHYDEGIKWVNVKKLVMLYFCGIDTNSKNIKCIDGNKNNFYYKNLYMINKYAKVPSPELKKIHKQIKKINNENDKQKKIQLKNKLTIEEMKKHNREQILYKGIETKLNLYPVHISGLDNRGRTRKLKAKKTTFDDELIINEILR
jgi:hypothetical protein